MWALVYVLSYYVRVFKGVFLSPQLFQPTQPTNFQRTFSSTQREWNRNGWIGWMMLCDWCKQQPTLPSREIFSVFYISGHFNQSKNFQTADFYANFNFLKLTIAIWKPPGNARLNQFNHLARWLKKLCFWLKKLMNGMKKWLKQWVWLKKLRWKEYTLIVPKQELFGKLKTSFFFLL